MRPLPDGMRAGASHETSAGTRTVASFWEGGRLIAERTGEGALYRFSYAPDNTPLALLLTRPGGSEAERYAFQVDHAGSVIGLTDLDGGVAAR